jgi:hypothetical protein
MLLFRMRDDIHRRLPLPRAWKRVVKACVRDAEAPFRASFLEQAARVELGKLRPTVVEDAARELSSAQAFLFPEAFKVNVMPASPIEAAFQRECAVSGAARLSVEETLSNASTRALEERLAAHVREIRAQVSVDFPRDCAELIKRVVAAMQDVDVATLVRRHIVGEPAQHLPPPTLDLDSDLRGQP